MNTDAIYARAKAAFAPQAPSPIVHGNADIEGSSTWVPTQVTPSASHLPAYPAPVDLLIETAR